MSAVDLILKDWNLILQEIKDFEELARCYRDFTSFQVARV